MMYIVAKTCVLYLLSSHCSMNDSNESYSSSEESDEELEGNLRQPDRFVIMDFNTLQNFCSDNFVCKECGEKIK